ncbi:MAG: hypothetical protein DRJ65_14250 [Acidobacteria bacterium]|nr:MAG: hypothetical protein DRJ65_14250 [Acidobacteriota bacterium]
MMVDQDGDPVLKSQFRMHRLAVLILLVASLVPLAAALRLDPRFPSDDALISLTYAKNLARGDGFVFNQPPPVLATTTPAFTLAVAGLTAVTGLEPTEVALWVSALCWLGLIWVFFIFREAFGLDPGQAVAVGCMVAAQGWVEYLSMEAYPFALILVLAAAMGFSRRWFFGGLAIGVLFLTRGEGVLFGAIMGLVVVAGEIKSRSEERSPTLMFVLGAALPLLLWSAFALPTFGSILPATLSAKMAQVASGLWAPFPVRLFEEWLPGWGVGPWGVISTVLGYVLVMGGLVAMATRLRTMLVFPAWGVVYAAGYSLLGVPGYAWYSLPVVFILTVTSALGLEAFIRWVLGGRGVGGIRAGLAWFLASSLIISAGWQTAGAIRIPQEDQRGPAYLKVARWLNDNSGPEQSVAFSEVGALGYYTDLAVVDLVGLVTPSMIPHVLNRDFATGFWEIQPDYLIELEGSEFTRPIVENPLFRGNYAAEVTLDGPEDRSLTIYHSKADHILN